MKKQDWKQPVHSQQPGTVLPGVQPVAPMSASPAQVGPVQEQQSLPTTNLPVVQAPAFQQPAIQQPFNQPYAIQTVKVEAPTDQYDIYQFETLVVGGWENLLESTKDDYQVALQYFEKAILCAGFLGINDHRLARAYVGKAWAKFRLDALAFPKNEFEQFDRSACYHSVLSDINTALAFYDNNRNSVEHLYRAKAQRLAGMLQIFMLNGTEADRRLKAAGADYAKALETNDVVQSTPSIQEEYAKTLYARGALACCQSKTKQARDLFRLAEDKATELDTKLAAFLDHTNTLLAMSRIRQANAQVIKWKRFEAEAVRKNKTIPLKTRYWANLLFARINLRSGDLAAAKMFLDLAEQNINDDFTQIERNVFWVINSEFLTVIGDFRGSQASTAHLLSDSKKSKYGYRLMRLLAIDSGCQMCVIESFCHCYLTTCSICCGCCCCCTSWLEEVCFEDFREVKTEFDVNCFFAAEHSRLSGSNQLAKGDYASAEGNLKQAIGGLDNVLGTDSPARLQPILELMRVQQLRQNETEFKFYLNQAIESANRHTDRAIINARLPKDHPIWPLLYEFSGTSRNLNSKYDLARTDFENAIQATATQKAPHSRQLIRQRIGLIDSLIGGRAFEDARKETEVALKELDEARFCDEIMYLELKEKQAIMCALEGCINQARRTFQRLHFKWQELRNEDYVHDSKRVSSALWLAITGLEMGLVDQSGEYSLFVSLASSSGMSNPAIAKLVTRSAVDLEKNKRFASAGYLYKRASEIYTMEGMHTEAAKVLRTHDEMQRSRQLSESRKPHDCD